MKEKKEAHEERNRKVDSRRLDNGRVHAHWQPENKKRMHPVIEGSLKINERILEVFQIDIDQEHALAETYAIENTPYLYYGKKGQKNCGDNPGELSLERLERSSEKNLCVQVFADIDHSPKANSNNIVYK